MKILHILRLRMLNIDNNQREVLLMLKAERTTRDVTEKLTSFVMDDDDKQLNFETHQSPKFKSIMVIVN